MQRFIEIFKKITGSRKRAIATGLAIVLVVSFTISGTIANGPCFNFMPGDYETFLLQNHTKGETVWHDPVTGAPEDLINMNIYFHNGIINTTAYNTWVKVDLPVQASKILVSKAHLSADNASAITDTGTINVTGEMPATLEYISGSTFLYPDQNKVPQPKAIQMPDGITSSGINIGNIKGCWEYAGFVVFQVRIKAFGTPNLSIDKTVRNVTGGESQFVMQNSANPGDELQYKIVVKNPGTAAAKEVRLNDIIPAQTAFVESSAILDGNKALSDTIIAGGVSLGNMVQGQFHTITLKVRINSNLYENARLVNTARVIAENVGLREAQAVTCVKIVVTHEADLSIVKTLKNISASDKDFQKNVSASPNDIIGVKLVVSNPGDANAEDVIVRDVLPQFTKYIPGSTEVADTSFEDGITGQGIKIGDLKPGQSVQVLFKIQISDCPAIGFHKLVNTGITFAKNVSEKRDSATICLKVSPPQVPVISIDKDVRNLTRGETNFVDANTGFVGDVVQYRIVFKNTGNGVATEVIFKDVLPQGMSFVSKSAFLQVGKQIFSLSDEIVENGVRLRDLLPGEAKTIFLKAKINSGDKAGDVLINTAHIFAKNIHKESIAQTTVKPQPIKIIITEKPVLVPTGTSAGMIAIYGILALSLIVYLREQLKVIKNKNKKA